ncbi:hypothetical protein EDD86DRAFT_260278 [Gorgonomyces haynaldii]|nr:hypothetical protein EDD86DRAFT_260278 [Gorgonomyces haynaldii]
MVPFLGVIMKDLSVIRETRPSVTDNGLLNFERSWEIYGVLKQMSDYQADPFVFPELDMDKQQFYGANHSRSSSSNSGLSMYCYHLPCDNEKVLDEKSKIIEPPSEQEDELGVLQSLWRNLGESVQLTVLKVHETRTRDPVERVKNARRFRTSAKEVLHRITPNGSVFFNQSQIFNESTIFSKQQDDLDEVNVL